MEQFLCPHCKKVFSVEQKPADMILYCPLCNGTVFLQASTGELVPGANLGGFEIIKLLGKGGMGNVYLARQSSMQRLVALKVLAKSTVGESDRGIIDMFNKEIQLSGKLNHPNIIKAINAGEDENYYFMAITYVEGEDFEKVLDKGLVIPEKEAFSLALKISNALNYAWEKHGLLHKDIKPGNIMKDKKGEIFLMDMGIAQHMVFGSTQREKEIHGSPFYMSPEQGQGFPLDWSTDMYSLGATIYHMIVGVPPYDSKEVTRIIEKHIMDPFPEASDRNPNIKLNKNSVSILKKMMAKKPEGRFSSWQEFDSAVNKAFFSNAPAARKKMPTKFAFSGSKVKKSSPISLLMILVNSFILLILAVVAAYFINDYRKTNAAQTNFNIAEKYYMQYPLNYDESTRLFALAKETSRDTSIYLKASRRYDEVSAKGAAFIAKAKDFDDTWVKAYGLFMNRKYQEAIDLVESIKEIEDPVRKNDAIKFINQIKEAMNSAKAAQPTQKNTKGK
ncbi:MAG: serine/threonine-protein kinase [Victivallales bacterium]